MAAVLCRVTDPVLEQREAGGDMLAGQGLEVPAVRGDEAVDMVDAYTANLFPEV